MFSPWWRVKTHAGRLADENILKNAPKPSRTEKISAT
jgi:hypothetical protein